MDDGDADAAADICAQHGFLESPKVYKRHECLISFRVLLRIVYLTCVCPESEFYQDKMVMCHVIL
jgi:hypothetical protein